MVANVVVEHCTKCGADLGAEGVCPACMIEEGLIEAAVAGGALEAAGLELPLVFGDYELLEELARGGMGVVYRARQRSLGRIVAVKMILTGRLSRVSDLQRFRAEAETAAQLQHPNIVAIHEVGEHDGLPFFAMDYIEGQSLAELTRNQPLSSNRAATYLRTISEAVQHAHSKGVLHRDLKPSNILIDGRDQPRVTDFGLAKRLQDPLEQGRGDGELTITGQVLGSPNFMPPEQATGNRKEAGPASDVYSLGAILYQLLTGRPPFMAETLVQTLRLVAEARPISPRLLIPTVPRDLETICLKCLQKEPQRRYATAQDLADDLSCFLQDKPILARPVSKSEYVWRWCRRNPGFASAVAAVAGLVLLVAVGSATAAFKIHREKVRAEQAGRNETALRHQAEAEGKKAKTEAARSSHVAQFLKEMLRGVDPSVALGRDATILQDILDRTAERIERDLKDEPEVQAELRSIIGSTYYSLADYKKAEEMQVEALRLRKLEFGSTNELVATSIVDLAMTRSALGRAAEGEAMQRDALAMRRGLFGNEHLAVADSLGKLAGDVFARGNAVEAETLQREAVAICRKFPNSDPEYVADILQDLGVTLVALKKMTQAEAACREAVEIQRRLSHQANPALAAALIRLGNVLENEGKPEEAEPYCREAVEIRRQVFGNNHPYVASALSRLASGLIWRHKLAEAEPLVRESLEISRRRADKDHPETLAGTIIYVAGVVAGVGKLAEAEALCCEALQSLYDHPPADPRLVGRGVSELVSTLNAAEKFNEAETIAFKYLEGRGTHPDWRALSIRSLLGESLLGQRRFEEAEPLLLSSCQELDRQRDIIPLAVMEHYYEAMQRLARLYEIIGRTNEAAVWRTNLEVVKAAEKR